MEIPYMDKGNILTCEDKHDCDEPSISTLITPSLYELYDVMLCLLT